MNSKLLIIILLFCFCKSTFAQQQNFSKIEKHTGIPNVHFAFFKHNNPPNSFFHELETTHIGIYYGNFVNDKYRYINSHFLAEVPSCSGRIAKELKTTKSPTDTIKASFALSDLEDNLHHSITADGKETIILLYNHSIGRKLKRGYKESYQFYLQHKDQYSLHVIIL